MSWIQRNIKSIEVGSPRLKHLTLRRIEMDAFDLLGGAFLGGSQHRFQGRLQRDAAARYGHKLQAMGPPDEGRLLRFAEENSE